MRGHHQHWQSGGSSGSSEAVAPLVPPWRLVDAPVMAHEAVAPRLEPPIVAESADDSAEESAGDEADIFIRN